MQITDEQLDTFIGIKMEQRFTDITLSEIVNHFKINDWSFDLYERLEKYCKGRGITFQKLAPYKEKFKVYDSCLRFRVLVQGRKERILQGPLRRTQRSPGLGSSFSRSNLSVRSRTGGQITRHYARFAHFCPQSKRLRDFLILS